MVRDCGIRHCIQHNYVYAKNIITFTLSHHNPKYNAKINLDGLLYNCGVELSPEGLFGRQDYVKHATRGTYTLHSLYLLLWANFGAFCMALLTQHKAEADIHGPIISKGLSVRHYCISQLRAVWMHMRNNLNLSDEERSFLVMACTNRLHKVWCSRSQC